MRAVAILTAAGSGTRLGHALPKALVPLAGIPLVVRAAHALTSSGIVRRIVVTAPPEALDDVVAALGAAPGAVPGLEVVPGGTTRQASVAAALACLADEPDDAVVLVHDAARPLVPVRVVRRVAGTVAMGRDAVVPALPVADTIKQVGPDGAVVRTLERPALRAVQTPQGFTLGALRSAHAAASHRADDEALAATDDAGLVEAAGGQVWVVEGHEDAMKITTPRDLVVATALVSALVGPSVAVPAAAPTAAGVGEP